MATDRTAGFAVLLRRHRLEAGLTQAALAERAALSVRAVQNLEAGLGQPQRETARRLAGALALTADQYEEFARAATPAPRLRTTSRASAPRADAPDQRRGVATVSTTATSVDLAGARKQVTVLSADIAGLTDSGPAFEPDAADLLLEEILRVLVDAAHLYGGTVTRADGDGLMALFGAPLGDEDHAIRACRAALAMQEAIRRQAEQVGRERDTGLALRVGLDSGEVVVRIVSNDLSSDYAAVGPAARIAARLGQVAESGATLLTRETFRLVEGHVQIRPVGPVEAHGLVEPVEAFELTGVGPPRSRFQVATARRLTSFVGRDAELASLSLPLLRARNGHGQVVAVVGEPGVGKSRLIYEFVRSPALDGWTVLEGGGVSYGKETPYLPLVGLLRTYFRIDAGDTIQRIREKVADRLLALDETLGSELPAVLSLLDVAIDDPAWQVLEPPERRRRIHDGCRRLLLRESRRRPLLMVIEDLHWIDGETRALLESVVGSLPGARMLLLVTYRPENVYVWSSNTHHTQLRVDPLPPESADELLQALLGDDSDLQPLTRLLIERTEGNPFFLEESIRTLVDTRALAGERGAYRLAAPLPNVRVPATVQAVLAARIDRLPPEDKRLLQTAAVIGKDVPYALLRAIGDVDEEGLRACLGRLRGAEFLYEAILFPEPLYSFKHALTHEVAYGSLLQAPRRTLHAGVVAAIERLHGEWLGPQVERLAHHALCAEAWEKAVAYSRQAGAAALARSANREAVAHLERALQALGRLPQSRGAVEQAIDLRIDLRQALSPLGEMERVIGYLREAEKLAETIGDQRRLGRVESLMIAGLWWEREYDRAMVTGRRALARAEATGDFAGQLTANYHLGLRYRDLGDYPRAVAALKWTVAALHGDLARERFGLGDFPAVGARGGLTWCLAELGAFVEGTAYGREAVSIAEALDHPYSLGIACFDLGGLYLRQGRTAEAVALLERGLGLHRTWDLVGLFATLAARLGAAYTLAGRLDEGLDLLEQVERRTFAGGSIPEGSLQTVWLGEAYQAAGRWDEARLHAERAVEHSVTQKNPSLRGWALRLLGELHAQHEPRDGQHAEASYREALTLAERLGMRPLQAHCRLGLGELYRRIGRVGDSRAELGAAVNLLREMGMTRWLPRAEAELARAGASEAVEHPG